MLRRGAKKGWVITVFSAIILFAVNKQKPLLYLFRIASVLSFWLIDALYRSTQNLLISQYRKIETFLRGDDFEKAMTEHSFGDFPVLYFQEGFSIISSPLNQPHYGFRVGKV